ncbi:MAG: 50S ribosomal protein L2, partial [Candidatus Bathyarchaeota archaeon]|nr:50S ribosomal protein L2 [Candidatus Bathyarchaeota archaeon]
MGKRIRVQRRGRGGSTFQASTHKRVAPARYPPISKQQLEGAVEGRVEKILHEPGRGSPLAKIKLQAGQDYHFIVPEGISEGQKIHIGNQAPIEVGNVLPLKNVPDGAMICG